jgi:hypothetical protein
MASSESTATISGIYSTTNLVPSKKEGHSRTKQSQSHSNSHVHSLNNSTAALNSIQVNNNAYQVVIPN